MTAKPSVPWFVTVAVLAITSAIVGGHWDISWHRSIGRDSFLSPPHVAIYLCGVLAGISAGWLVLHTTLRGSEETRAACVSVFGFRAPLGAFIMAWGGIAMLTSAPFDNWWHSAYGLDVEILSPPHVVLLSGIAAIQLGTLILVLAEMNRSQGRRRAWHEALFLYVGGVMLTTLLLVTMEYTFNAALHAATCYRALAIVVPVVLVGVARATGRRGAATIVALVYTAFLLGFLWILPRFPAEPKLGPVFNPVTHFVPAGFPLLVVVPALAIDLVLGRGGRRRWLLAGVLGVVFTATFLAAEWPFASFLMTPAARSWVFGAHYFDYLTGPDTVDQQYLFYAEESLPGTWLVVPVLLAIASSGVGLLWGDGMREIRR